MDFEFFVPTKVIFGKNCIIENSHLLKEYGPKAFVVTGKKSALLNGAEADVRLALNKNGIECEIFNSVETNPSVETVKNGAEAAKQFNADFIIGIGGGSPLDAAKAIAALAYNSFDNDEKIFDGEFKNKILPVIAVPTTAGTGSEVTQYSILTYNKIKSKKNLSSPQLFPKIAFCDAKYTEFLSYEITNNTAVDALTHAIEGYLTIRSNEMSSHFALESIRIIRHCLGFLVKENRISSDIREQLLYGSMLAGMVIAHTGTTALHSMGYHLTYFHNVDHGRANGLLLAEFLRYIEQENKKVKTILDILEMKNVDELKLFLNNLLRKVDDVSEDDIRAFAEMAANARSTSFTFPKPSVEDIIRIYSESLM